MSEKNKILRPACWRCGTLFRGRKKWYKFDKAVAKCGAELECATGGNNPVFFIIPCVGVIVVREKTGKSVNRINSE